jgi:hypothetical protein
MSGASELLNRWSHIQGTLFPWLREEVGELTRQHERVVLILDTLGLETHVPGPPGGRGRPPEDRRAIARAFVAKAVLALPTTAALLDRLDVDARLRRICGWERRRQVPSEATFSRAFAEFAASGLPDTVHAALIRHGFENRVVGHIARDATEIEGREKPPPPPPATKPRKRGRPKTGEAVEKRRSDRLKRQPGLTLRAMLAGLPTRCDVGTKRNAKGFRHSWAGYKLHIDVADGDIPVAAILTAASLHDSQAAIPLIKMTSARVLYLYDIMDSAYAAAAIGDYSRSLGHQPIIVGASDRHAPGRKAAQRAERKRLARLGFETVETRLARYRTAAERVAGRLKNDFGAAAVRVRGHAKVFCHLGFALIALTAENLLRLAAPSPRPL